MFSVISKRRRGFTILEAILALSVSALMFTLFLTILVPAMRISGREAARAELQQQAASALRRIVGDLRQSAVGGVSLLPDPAEVGVPAASAPTGVALVRQHAVSSSQRPTWEGVLIFYYRNPQDRRLYRRTFPPGPPTGLDLGLSTDRPALVPPSALVLLAGSRASTTQVVAHDVEAFEVTPSAGGTTVSNPLVVTIEVARSVGPQHEEGQDTIQRFHLRQAVVLRNQL